MNAKSQLARRTKHPMKYLSPLRHIYAVHCWLVRTTQNAALEACTRPLAKSLLTLPRYCFIVFGLVAGLTTVGRWFESSAVIIVTMLVGIAFVFQGLAIALSPLLSSFKPIAAWWRAKERKHLNWLLDVSKNRRGLYNGLMGGLTFGIFILSFLSFGWVAGISVTIAIAVAYLATVVVIIGCLWTRDKLQAQS